MALLFSLEGSAELTLKFSGSAAGLVRDSFLSLGGSVERSFRSRDITDYQYVLNAGLDVVHGVWTGKDSESGFGCLVKAEGQRLASSMGQCALRIRASFGSTRLIRASFGSTRLIRASFGSTRLIRASFGSTRLICVSFGSTRLICVSFGSTRLICASFGSTRLICAFYGTTRLLCRVGVQRGADRREAGRVREGHMDASGFLFASAMYLSRCFDCYFGLVT
ncbi:NAC-alpha domain-containing protein 1 [Cucumis melo var. makuwa]|uniref:NAC-alpha domain-containing protein 1 n=1 Tax=Cucumis melo var. makuwa TaxID=1194695 RepID=A0A5A7U222_CUCMM|nr:NAC-alpha domain-containing protein 1 [Cucumis melo var. makuwa]